MVRVCRCDDLPDRVVAGMRNLVSVALVEPRMGASGNAAPCPWPVVGVGVGGDGLEVLGTLR
jgi:hypothetical protein